MRKARAGTVAIETVLVMFAFVLAAYVLMRLGMAVIKVFYGDGYQLIGIPLF